MKGVFRRDPEYEGQPITVDQQMKGYTPGDVSQANRAKRLWGCGSHRIGRGRLRKQETTACTPHKRGFSASPTFHSSVFAPGRSRLTSSPRVAVVRKQRSDKSESGNFLADALDRDLLVSQNFVSIFHNHLQATKSNSRANWTEKPADRKPALQKQVPAPVSPSCEY